VKLQIKDVTEEMQFPLTLGFTLTTLPMKLVPSIKLEDTITVLAALQILNAEIVYQEKDAGLKKMLRSMESMNTENLLLENKL
jgi:hypothetical protein